MKYVHGSLTATVLKNGRVAIQDGTTMLVLSKSEAVAYGKATGLFHEPKRLHLVPDWYKPEQEQAPSEAWYWKSGKDFEYGEVAESGISGSVKSAKRQINA